MVVVGGGATKGKQKTVWDNENMKKYHLIINSTHHRGGGVSLTENTSIFYIKESDYIKSNRFSVTNALMPPAYFPCVTSAHWYVIFILFPSHDN